MRATIADVMHVAEVLALCKRAIHNGYEGLLGKEAEPLIAKRHVFKGLALGPRVHRALAQLDILAPCSQYSTSSGVQRHLEAALREAARELAHAAVDDWDASAVCASHAQRAYQPATSLPVDTEPMPQGIRGSALPEQHQEPAANRTDAVQDDVTANPTLLRPFVARA